MSRRIRRGHQERERLLQRAIHAGEHERHLIAADLHDSAVQSLAGTAFALAGAAHRIERNGQPADAAVVGDASVQLRQVVRELRTLIVAIAPPRLHEEGLGRALEDLVSPLGGRGVQTQVDMARLPALSEETESLLFRAAQEAIRNAVRHAGASIVAIHVSSNGDGQVQLCVQDDGQGITQDESSAHAAAHLGTSLLAQLASDAGGSFTIDTAPGHGTNVRIQIPTS
jgi:signal transduction histidine kinase